MKIIPKMRHLLEATSSNIVNTVDSVNQNMASAVKSTHDELHQKVEFLIERSSLQVERFDLAMEEELNKALRTFGYQLTALSEKFVNDYTPLTNRLKEVVELAVEKERAVES